MMKAGVRVALALSVLIAGCSQANQAAQEPTVSSSPTGTAPLTTASTQLGSPSFADEIELDPITGYGDFSDVEYDDIDWYEVTRLEVQCLNDQGFAAELIPPGDGISFAAVPADQAAMASATFRACEAGLDLPEPVPADEDRIREYYDFLLELRDCIENEGYPTSDPPSLEAFIDSWNENPWHPYDVVAASDEIQIEEWNALNVACPQQ